VLPDGSMLAHWLARSPDAGKYGYGIHIARRAPGRAEWREIHGMSIDEKEDYAGFLSFVPGTPAAVYLSPPLTGSHEGHRKTVRFLSLKPDGTVASDREIDADACSCCQTAVARTRKGLLAAYRDHLPGEMRDISIVRFADGVWSEPKPLYRDGWVINGCPTEGPSIAAEGDEVGIAWLTRANEQPRVQVSLSHNAGDTFGAPLRIDGGNPLGRPSLVRFDARSYLAVWLEKTTGDRAEIRLRRIGFDGRLQAPFVASTAMAGRSTGFPKIAVSGKQIIVTWRDERVRAALISKSQFTTEDF